MRLKLLFAALFSALLYLGIDALSLPATPPPQLIALCEAPAALPEDNPEYIACAPRTAHAADTAHHAPHRPLPDAPALRLCYYRSAYQAFHLSASAG